MYAAPFIAFLFGSSLAPPLPGETPELLARKEQAIVKYLITAREFIDAIWAIHDQLMDRGKGEAATSQMKQIRFAAKDVDDPLKFLWRVRARLQWSLLATALRPRPKSAGSGTR